MIVDLPESTRHQVWIGEQRLPAVEGDFPRQVGHEDRSGLAVREEL
jgi:hypothetical protein